MRSIILLIITISIGAVFNMPSDVSAASITIGGREWRKFTDTNALFSHDDLATIYDIKTGQLSGTTTTLKGIDFAGWTWGNNADAKALAELYTNVPLDPILTSNIGWQLTAYNSSWAPQILTDFGVTSQNSNQFASYVTTRSVTNGLAGNLQVILPVTNGLRGIDYIGTNAHGLPTNTIPQDFGVLLYRTPTTAPIPEPGTIALFGIGLLGMAGAKVRSRRKKKPEDISKVIISQN